MTVAQTRRTALQTLLGLLGAAAAPTSAADYPDKPIHLLVPFPPGGLTDVLGRMVGERLRKALNQAVVVENKPGGYNFASPGSGTVHHLLIEMLKAQENLNVPHVPYQGSGPALTDMMTGRIDFMLIDASIGVPQVRANKIKLLAVAASKRSALAPETPTLNETYPKLDLQAWQSIAAPAGTPPAIVAKLNAEINRELATPEFRAELSKVGLEARPMGVAEFNEMIRKDAPRWAELVRLSGAKAN